MHNIHKKLLDKMSNNLRSTALGLCVTDVSASGGVARGPATDDTVSLIATVK